MKRIVGMSLLAVTLASTSGCGWIWGEKGYFRDRGNDYLQAQQIPPMQMPEGAQNKRLDPLLPIPRHIPDADPKAEVVSRPEPMAIKADEKVISLQKSGATQWLIAQRIPAEIWPIAQQYFEESGLSIVAERPQTGEFITAWSKAQNFSASLADRTQSLAGSEARVLVRIEPGVQRNTSEIFLITQVRPVGSALEQAWEQEPGTTSFDNALIEDFRLNLEQSAIKGGSVSLAASAVFDAPSRVQLLEAQGQPYLKLDASFDRAWSSIGRALDGANIRVDDLNRSTGSYFVDVGQGKKTEKPGFFKRLFSSSNPDKKAERYVLQVTGQGRQVNVTVLTLDNQPAAKENAVKVLQRLQNSLN